MRVVRLVSISERRAEERGGGGGKEMPTADSWHTMQEKFAKAAR